MMRQQSESKTTPLNQMDENQIIAHFIKYGFTDKHGHPLENCVDFLDLIQMATNSN